MKTEINFFQDGIPRRIADEYLGFTVIDARTDNNNEAEKVLLFSLQRLSTALRFFSDGIFFYYELFIGILCIIISIGIFNQNYLISLENYFI